MKLLIDPTSDSRIFGNQSVFYYRYFQLECVSSSVVAEEIPSDEDEVSRNQNAMQGQQCSTLTGQGSEEDDEDDEDYWDDDCFEGTPLEEYSTPLDYDNGEDEYQFFTAALLSKS